MPTRNSVRTSLLLAALALVLMGAGQCKTFPQMEQNLSESQNQVSILNAEIVKLKDIQRRLIRDKNALEEKYAALRKEKTSSERKTLLEITGLKERVTNLAARLDDRNKDVSELRALQKSDRLELRRIQDILTRREKKISSLEERLSFARKEQQREKSEKEGVQKNNRDLSSRLALMSSQLRNSEKQLAAALRKYGELEKKKTDIEKTVSTDEKRLRGLEKENSAYKKEIERLRPRADQVTGLRENLLLIQKENSKLLKNLKKAKSRIEILDRTLLVSENEKKNSKEDILSLGRDNQTLQKEHDRTLETIKKLKISLDKSLGEQTDLRERLSQAMAGKKSALDKLNRIQEKSRQAIEKLNKENQSIIHKFSRKIKEAQVKMKEVEGKLVITFVDKVLFDSAKADVKKSAQRALNNVAELLKKYPNRHVVIEGHTDSEPIHNWEFSSNWELSITRATRVLRYLVDHEGVSPSQLSAEGYSSYRPVDTNATPAGRSNNRRVEIVIQPEKLKRTTVREPVPDGTP